MKSSARVSFAIPVVLLLALSMLGRSAAAFDDPLSPEAIRDAYFLAKGDASKRTDFFAKYTHALSVPQTGPNISSIEIETPFACVVDDIATHGLNYHAPDAQQDYFGKPAEFRVRVQMYFTATYPTVRSTRLGSFWNDFHIHLKQGSEIAARSERGVPIYSDQTTTGYIGATIVADYDSEKIQSGPATVEVTGPDGSKAETAFDLDSLR